MGSACGFLLVVLLPGGHRSARTHRDPQPLQSGCKVWRGTMVQCTPMYSWHIPFCFEEQTPAAELCCPDKLQKIMLPNPDPLELLQIYQTGFIFVISSCLCHCRAPEQLVAWSVSSLKKEGQAVLNSWFAGFWSVRGSPQLQDSFCPISFPACGSLFQPLFSQTGENQSL